MRCPHAIHSDSDFYNISFYWFGIIFFAVSMLTILLWFIVISLTLELIECRLKHFSLLKKKSNPWVYVFIAKMNHLMPLPFFTALKPSKNDFLLKLLKFYLSMTWKSVLKQVKWGCSSTVYFWINFDCSKQLFFIGFLKPVYYFPLY